MSHNGKIVATVGKAVQVGTEEWDYINTSKVFNVDATIQEIFDWAESLGIKGISVASINFSNCSE